MVPESKVPTKSIEEFISRLRQAAGPNLLSVILYGSAASGEFDPEFSDINLLCILREASFQTLAALAPAIDWWHRQRQPTPLLMTGEELERSSDVFVIELMDIQSQHRVLYGEDVLERLAISTQFHRVQVEYELREKLILLRQRMLRAAANDGKLWELMFRSLSAFTALFRHALLVVGERAPANKREVLHLAASRFGFDISSFEQVLNVREHKAKSKELDAKDIAGRYLSAVEKVTAAVDKTLDSPGPRSS
jgi:predicted nucleotidyltransferase